MAIEEIILERRNIKQFKPDPISEEQILAWLEVARNAPNHRLNQPWEVIFVGPEARARIGHAANFGDAPVVLAFVAKSSQNPLERDENVIAVSCFVQNFVLTAWEAGVGTRWTSIGATPASHTILGVPDEDVVVGILGVGYPAQVPPARERAPISEKLRRLS